MSNAARFHDHARRSLDQEISAGYAALDASARLAFSTLLAHLRARTALLRPGAAGITSTVRAIIKIAGHHDEYRAAIADWPGGVGDERALVHSLVHHLLARYPVPPRMTAVWFGDDDPANREERRWWVAHAGGRAFREIDGLPLRLTRRMEHILIHDTPADLGLRAAMRRAELLGLDAPPELVAAVLATDLAADLEHGDFWRSVFHWFIRHWSELGPSRVGPLVDFFYARRIRSVEVMTPCGSIIKPPPDPTFAIAGRTPDSLQRLIDEWHAELAVRRHSGRTWSASGFGGFVYVEPPREGGDDAAAAIWRIEEILHSSELRFEGRVLHHCVASYEWKCLRGVSSIWSVRRQAGEGQAMSRYTIEVEPGTRKVVQIRGLRNSRVSGLPQQLIALWAEQERLEVLATA